MNVAIIGAGVFGRAIGSLLEYNQVEFEYADVSKPLTRIPDVAFLMVPSQYLRGALKDNEQWLSPDTVFINGAKGIEESTHELPCQIVASLEKYPHYYSLVGPSFAHGISAQEPTLVSLGYQDPASIKTISDLLQTPYFRVTPVKGREALELAGALKNLYAILCGYAQGLGFGMNAQALLITQALNEYEHLAASMGFEHYDVLTPGVVGDLVLTCSSAESRNYKFGQHLAKAQDPDVIKQEHGTVEGYFTSHSISYIAEQQQITLPLAALTQQLITDPASGAESFRAYIASL